ncbi:MAG: UDP-glucose/GDP-mannose dehydrogenase family protein [Bradymonadaceae bacterium]
MNVAVVGTGYVGLVTGACLANTGVDVTCIDKDPELVAQLEEGDVPIFEEGLDHLVEDNLRDGRLSFTTGSGPAIAAADIVFIAVGTPMDEDGSPDLSAVEAVARDIGDHVEGETVVVCKSTVPVGTCDRIAEIVGERTDQPYEVVSNPEFMKEGSAVRDFQSPSRVVIGCENEEVRQQVADLYRPFFQRSERFVMTDRRTAEMIKYASNSMLATKISFMNELSNICDEVGADVEQVREGMSMDERIGPHFIYPGVGFGGSCFPKDVRALAELGRQAGVEADMLESVTRINERQKLYLYDRAREHFGSLEGLDLAVWGLSFKPRTDDIREAPSLVNLERFVEDGASVRATDPEAIENAREALSDLEGDLEFSADDYAVLEGADALFLFTEWEEFRNPNFERIRELMDRPVIFDGRNIYPPEKLERMGFTYVGVGRN